MTGVTEDKIVLNRKNPIRRLRNDKKEAQPGLPHLISLSDKEIQVLKTFQGDMGVLLRMAAKKYTGFSCMKKFLRKGPNSKWIFEFRNINDLRKFRNRTHKMQRFADLYDLFHLFWKTIEQCDMSNCIEINHHRVIDSKLLVRLVKEQRPDLFENMEAEYYVGKNKMIARGKRIEDLMAAGIPLVIITVPGYIINQPGVYQLANDIAFNPAGPNQNLFTINADDVTLDGLDHFIRKKPSNTQPGSTGIYINGSRCCVKNFHSISFFTLVGIQTSGTAQSEIKLQNILATNNGTSTATAGNITCGGIFLSNVDNVELSNCTCNKNIGFGVSLTAVTNLISEKLIANEQTGKDGIYPFGTLGCGVFEFTDPVNNAPIILPISACKFEGTQTNKNTGAQAAFGFVAASVPQLGNAPNVNIIVKDIQAYGNEQTDPAAPLPTGSCLGVAVSGDGSSLSKVNVTDNKNANSLFAFENQSVQIFGEGCTIIGVLVDGVSGGSVFEAMCGIGLEVNPQSTSIVGCKVNNVVNSAAFLIEPRSKRACGFYICENTPINTLGIDFEITKCVATNVVDGPGFWTNGARCVNYFKCKAKTCEGGFLIMDVATDSTVGPTYLSNDIHYRQCFASNNLSYGFKEDPDTANGQPIFATTYHWNETYKNGATFAGDTTNNYVNVNNININTYIATTPHSNGNWLDNQSIGSPYFP